MKLESYILNDFFEILNKIDANYCIMNNYINMPEIIPSDVDIALDEQTFGMLDALIINLAKKHNVVITQKIWHGYNKCAYILSPLNIDDYFWLQLDFFVDFSGRGFPNLLPNNIMLSEKIKYKNFYIPKPKIEVPFILQRRIFKSDIEEKHIQILVKLYNKNIEAVQRGIVNIFGKKEGESLIKFLESEDINFFKDNFPSYRKRLKKISEENTTFIYKCKYIIWQFIRAIYRFYYPTGLSIGFIGQDSLEKQNFIKIFNNKISGSFHGTTFFKPKDIKEYFENMSIKDYWSKVTKRKTLWNLDSLLLDWEGKFDNSYFIPKPDVIIKLSNKLESEDISRFMNESINISLRIQSERTKRHLMNNISPTGKRKVK